MHRDNKIDTKDKKCLSVRNIEKKRNQKSKCIQSKIKYSKFQKETQGGTTKMEGK